MKNVTIKMALLVMAVMTIPSGCSKTEFQAEAFADVYTKTTLVNGTYQESVVQVVFSSATISSVESTDGSGNFVLDNSFGKGNAFVSESPRPIDDTSYSYVVNFENGSQQEITEASTTAIIDPAGNCVANLNGDKIELSWNVVNGADAYSVILKRAESGSSAETIVPLLISGYITATSYQFQYQPLLFEQTGENTVTRFYFEVYAFQFEDKVDPNDNTLTVQDFTKYKAVSVSVVDWNPVAP